MAYIGKSPSTGVRNRFIYTATAGQTTFSGTDDHNRTLSYTDAEFTDVFLNGVKLDKSDYTATSGTSIVLDSGATVGDTLEVLGFDTFSVFSGEFSQDVTIGGAATLTGDLTVDTNTLHVDSTNNRVGVGTDSPDTIAEIRGANPIVTIRDTETSSGSAEATLRLAETGASDSLGSYWDIKSSGGKLEFIDNWDEGGGTGTRVTLTDSGNVQIGSTNSGVAGAAVDVSIGHTGTNGSGGITLFSPTNGTHSLGFADGATGTDRYRGYVEYQHASDRMDFATSSTARMTIDSTGQVAIGKTSASVSNAGLHIAGNETADGSPAYIYSVKTFSGTRNVLLNYHSGSYVGGVNMSDTATSFPTSSDERLKKNIVDAPSAGDKIDAMQVRSFNWKADDSFQEYGLIAQELQSVYDLPVQHHDTEDTYTVDYSKLVPVLLKEIQDLRKRVATLEAS